MLQEQLDTQIFGIGDRLVFLPTVDSTNTQAMHLALEGSDEGVVVLTDNQTAGRGRLGRRWIDRAGYNVLLSTIVRPDFPPYLLVMIASLAVVEAIRQSCGITATIKWPNDVLIGQRKVAGILIETSHDRAGRMVAIVGIGVNVNGHISELLSQSANVLSTSPSRSDERTASGGTGDDEAPQTSRSVSQAPEGELEPSQANVGLHTSATTLETECGHSVSRELFVTYLLHQLESNYQALQQEAHDPTAQTYGVASRLAREQWRAQLSTLGRAIQVRQGNTTLSGLAEDVNDVGELLLRTHSGEQVSITWGDVGYPTE